MVDAAMGETMGFDDVTSEYDRMVLRQIQSVVRIFSSCAESVQETLMGKSGASDLSMMWDKFQANDERGLGRLPTNDFALGIIGLKLGINRKKRQDICEVLEDPSNPGRIDYDIFIESIRAFRESELARQLKERKAKQLRVLDKINRENDLKEAFSEETKLLHKTQIVNNTRHRQVMQKTRSLERESVSEDRSTWTGLQKNGISVGIDSRRDRSMRIRINVNSLSSSSEDENATGNIGDNEIIDKETVLERRNGHVQRYMNQMNEEWLNLNDNNNLKSDVARLGTPDDERPETNISVGFGPDGYVCFIFF